MRFQARDPVTVVAVGRWLAVAFGVCFLTGLLSHYAQHPVGWLPVPTAPSWGYRFTQGLHVASGIASIPLLLVKLWTVYPNLWQSPPVRSVVHAVERASVAVLVGGALFQLVTGVLNVVQWYPWRFSFPVVHYWVAWVTIGALLVHVAVHLPAITQHWSAGTEVVRREGLSRRGLLMALGTAAGAVTLATLGQTVRPLAAVSVLAPRDPRVGPQRLPVNRTAAAAGVTTVARDPAYTLTVVGPRPYVLDLAALEALPRVEADLPIACVEGWSAGARWQGVPVRALLDRAGIAPGARVRVVSLERSGTYRTSVLEPGHARAATTLLALELNGERLDLDHGYPVRLIGPNRPGVLQTKWVTRLEAL